MTFLTKRPLAGGQIVAVPMLFLLMSGTAQAALTADQVWQSWKDAAALAGLQVSAATEAKDGGSLMLNGVTIGPDGAAGLTISDMVLAEQSDGSVLITPGADIGLVVAEGGTDSAMLKIGHEGLTLTAREESGGLIYDYAAQSLVADFSAGYAATQLGDAATAEPASSVAKVSFDGLSGTYSDKPGTNRAFSLAVAAQQLAYDITTNDPGLPLKNVSQSKTTDVALTFDMAMPQTVSLMALKSAADFQKALQEGMRFAITSKQGVSEGAASQTSAFMPYEMTLRAEPGDAAFVFNKDAFSVKSAGAGIAVNLTSTALPVPVAITTGPVMVNMLAPIASGDLAGDFAYQMKISHLSVNEEAWGLVDPAGALKHDPADLSVDVTGKAKIDFLAMAVADETGGVPPIPAPEVLNINDLTLMVAGATFAATGAFTFDNSAGVPVPLGEANASLTGGNALIDGLIKTGMITEQNAMSARMMMSMFMAPGADADTLTTKIEAKAGNEIYVNGQRVQ